VLALAGVALQPALTALAAQYGSNFQLQGLSLQAAVGVLAGAGVLGWLGAVFVTGHYLRQTRPGVG
jgi:cell division transport system permease protein